jgi:hypothetical protein
VSATVGATAAFDPFFTLTHAVYDANAAGIQAEGPN